MLTWRPAVRRAARVATVVCLAVALPALGAPARTQAAPYVVNVVAAILVLLSIVPIYLSQRLAGETTAGGRI